MTNILIAGAGGQIARHVVAGLHNAPDLNATLMLRDAAALEGVNTDGMRIIEGDVGDAAKLKAAMSGQDIVYANLFGDMDGWDYPEFCALAW